MDYSHGSLFDGHGEVVEDVRPAGALPVRHPRILDAHHRRVAIPLSTAAASSVAVVVFILQQNLFFENQLCEFSHQIEMGATVNSNKEIFRYTQFLIRDV